MNKLIVNGKNWRTGEIVKRGHIEVVCHLITNIEVDAIISNTGPYFEENDGHAKSIIEHGGDSIQKELDDNYNQRGGGIWYGDNAVTGPGKLNCKHIIHTCGPIYCQLDPQVAGGHLYNCVMESLNRAHKLGDVASVAMPILCTGMYGAGFPKEDAAEIIVTTCVEWLQENGHETKVKEIKICDFDRRACRIAENEIVKLGFKEEDLVTIKTRGDMNTFK